VALGFWQLDHPAQTPALVSDAGLRLTYGELREGSDRFSTSLSLSQEKTLGLVLCTNTPECLMAYLGSLRSGQAVCLLDAALPLPLLRHLLELYDPDWVFTADRTDLPGFSDSAISGGFLYRDLKGHAKSPIAPELALLLTTSGSTGSPKQVRLSLANLQANAESIATYLDITAEQRPLTSLPMSYSYGLSVLNSHLLRGSELLMTVRNLTQRDYWDFASEYRPTSMAAVPYQCELMLRLRLFEHKLSGLRTLTQAGGRLDPDRISQIEAIGSRRGWRFFVMYGQTEATARIAYVPPERLVEKIGSIGIAIPGGTLDLDEATGELLYSGPNVMLGYAESRNDLARGDDLKGLLRTGDLARRDEDGYHYLTGRLKRILKVFGKRVSLDEMEALIGNLGGGSVACFGSDDDVRIAVETAASEQIADTVIKDMLRMHPSAFRIVKLASLPRLPNSKIDYQSLIRVEGP
jgi:long-chain acyl-CoA synthetase